MDLTILLGLTIVTVLIVANGLFVATEFAYVAARRSRLQGRADAGSKGARVAVAATRDLDRYVAASQLGITMASLALGFVGEPLFAGAIEPTLAAVVGTFAPELAHAVAILLAFFLITALHIIFGELVPKTIALQLPESTAEFVSRPMRLFAIVFRPLIGLLNGIGNAILRVFGIATVPIGQQKVLTSSDLAYAFESSASVGVLSRQELGLAQRALELGEVAVRSLTIPRAEVTTIRHRWELGQVRETIGRSGRSRYPVTREGSLDDVVGMLHARDVLLDPGTDWRRHIRPIAYLPDSTVLGGAIEVLAAKGGGIALIVDEYGNVDGMVALADIMGYLAGPLADEREDAVPAIHQVGDLRFEVDGVLRLGAASEPPLSLPKVATEATTVGGLVVERLQRLPVVGDVVVVGRHRLRVLELEDRRIGRVEVTLDPSAREGHDRG